MVAQFIIGINIRFDLTMIGGQNDQGVLPGCRAQARQELAFKSSAEISELGCCALVVRTVKVSKVVYHPPIYPGIQALVDMTFKQFAQVNPQISR